MDDESRVGWLGKAWIASIFGYSVIRALVVWPTLGDYGVNPWAFLAVDIGTAWPYAYGQVRVVNAARARAWGETQRWALISLLAFIAPYAYIAGAGSGRMPIVAWVIVLGLMVAFGVASVIRIRRLIRSDSDQPGS